MSTQKGNAARNRPQKYKNITAFRNDLHDTRPITKMLNDMEVYGVCQRCKEQIEWKIRYKKYKPLTVPKKCVKCSQKAVKRAYTVACEPCGEKLNICIKCLSAAELVPKTVMSSEEELKQKQRLEAELRLLSERQRRTFERSVKDGTAFKEFETPLVANSNEHEVIDSEGDESYKDENDED